MNLPNCDALSIKILLNFFRIVMGWFVDDNRADALCLKLDDYRSSNRYTDIIVKTDGEDFPAHRMVLASSSQFWTAMFEGDFAEQSKDTVSLKNIESADFTRLLSNIG